MIGVTGQDQEDCIPQEGHFDQSEQKGKNSLGKRARLPDLTLSGGDCPEWCLEKADGDAEPMAVL